MVENDQLFVQLQIKNLYRRIPKALFLKADKFIRMFEKIRKLYAIKNKDVDIMTVNEEFGIQIFDVNFYITVHLDMNVHDEL